MKKIILLIISVILSFLFGISILFVAMNVFFYVNGFGISIVDILIMIPLVFLLIVPNILIYKKACDNKKLFIIINIISVILGFILSVSIN